MFVWHTLSENNRRVWQTFICLRDFCLHSILLFSFLILNMDWFFVSLFFLTFFICHDALSAEQRLFILADQSISICTVRESSPFSCPAPTNRLQGESLHLFSLRLRQRAYKGNVQTAISHCKSTNKEPKL